MKKSSLLILSLLASFIGYANKTKFYIASKDGFTITIGGTYEDTVTQQNLLNDYLDFIVKKLPVRPKKLKMVIMIGDFGIWIVKRELWKEYAYVRFDTILKPDTIFVNSSQRDYYNLPVNQNYFLSVPYALSEQEQFYSKNDVGILIKYLSFDTSINNVIDRILTIAEFAINNITLIQQEQSSLKMPSHLYGEAISIVSYDTSKIRMLKTISYRYGNHENFWDKYVWKTVIVILVITILMLLKSKYLKKSSVLFKR